MNLSQLLCGTKCILFYDTWYIASSSRRRENAQLALCSNVHYINKSLRTKYLLPVSFLPNSCLTRLAPVPTKISSNSEPEAWKNGPPPPPETAGASNDFPIPGGPTSKTPGNKTKC